jgi:hypothetical protein
MTTTSPPLRLRPSPATPQEDAIVILVHGTFAGDQKDAGDKWWQAGSEAAVELQSRLPRGVRVAENSEVFHWSGENSERARSKAALQLLDRLHELEGQSREYHLVGHSHGGSVIWNALKMTTLTHRPLENLKSWTTVGTPYLQHRSRSAWSFSNLAGLAAGLFLLPPAFRSICRLTELLVDAVIGNNVAMYLEPDDQAGYVAILRSPILSTLEWLGVAVQRTPEGIHVGNYDPNSGMSLMNYLFATPEGLLLLTTILIVSYVFLHLSMISLRPAIESFRIRSEQRLQRRAFDDYGTRYLAIWSPDDEAINGLRATLHLSVSFVGKMMPQERVFLSDSIGLLSRPYYWLFAPLFNRWVQPPVDRMVRNMVRRSAQGNDRPTATIIDVTPSPIGELRDRVPPLPPSINEQILTTADHHARNIAPKLRKLLGEASLMQGMDTFCKELSGRELVHTSYFDHPDVIELISCNITWGMGDGMVQWKTWRMDPKIAQWFDEAKLQLLQELNASDCTPQIEPMRKIPA